MFILYSTLGCHLCEHAQEVLHQCIPPSSYRIVDIAEDEQLMERYATSIPVVRHEGTGEEIGWPFDVAVFQSWLAKVER